VHPDNERRFGTAMTEAVDEARKKERIEAACLYRLRGNGESQHCGPLQVNLARVLRSNAERIVKQAEVGRQDAEILGAELRVILDSVGHRCDLNGDYIVNIGFCSCGLTGEVTVPCVRHGNVEFEFEIGEITEAEAREYVDG